MSGFLFRERKNLNMKINFNKNCFKCGWGVWDACIQNIACRMHCLCPENKLLLQQEKHKDDFKKKKGRAMGSW